MTVKKLNQQQAWWSLYLSQFDFMMHHCPGHTMGKCHALLFWADHGTGIDDNHNLTLLCPEFFVICALQGVTFKGAEWDIACEIQQGICNGATEDAVAQAITGLAKSHGKLLYADEWRQVDGLWYFHDKIYIQNILNLQWRIAEQHHNLKITGHAGCRKTLKLISWNYWWPHMLWFIGEYCKACDLCLWTKAQHCKPIGELHPLLIPENCWDTVSINFISKLPESHGYDAIMVVVNSTGKCGHFIPTHTMATALGSAWLYLQHVWKLHPQTSAFCPVQLWPTVHVAVHVQAVSPPWHQSHSIHCLPSTDQWPDGTCQPRTGAILMCFHKWEAGWLGRMAAYGW